MSYEIIYDRAAIKVGTDKYLTLLISGSNNCFDVLPNGRECRERNWSENYLIRNSNTSYHLLLTRAEISKRLDMCLKKIEEKVRKDTNYVDKNLSSDECMDIANQRFAYYIGVYLQNKQTTFAKVKRYIMNAVDKYAATPDEYAEAGHPVEATVYYHDQHQKCLKRSSTILTNDNIECVVGQFDDSGKDILHIDMKGVCDERSMVMARTVMFPNLSKSRRSIINDVKDYYIRVVEKGQVPYGDIFYSKGLHRISLTSYNPRTFFTERTALAKVKKLNKIWSDKYEFTALRKKANSISD